MFCFVFFLSLCPPFLFLGLGLVLVLGLGLVLGLALGLGLGFKPSSPIVRELVLSLTRLSFPLVRFTHSTSSRRRRLRGFEFVFAHVLNGLQLTRKTADQA